MKLLKSMEVFEIFEIYSTLHQQMEQRMRSKTLQQKYQALLF